MIVLRINKPEKDIWPHWASPGMNHLDGAEFIFEPSRVHTSKDAPDYLYRIDGIRGFVTPTDMSLDYVWNLNTEWLEVVKTDGEDLSELEKLGINIPDIYRFKGPITLSTIGTYHDRSKS